MGKKKHKVIAPPIGNVVATPKGNVAATPTGNDIPLTTSALQTLSLAESKEKALAGKGDFHSDHFQYVHISNQRKTLSTKNNTSQDSYTSRMDSYPSRIDSFSAPSSSKITKNYIGDKFLKDYPYTLAANRNIENPSSPSQNKSKPGTPDTPLLSKKARKRLKNTQNKLALALGRTNSNTPNASTSSSITQPKLPSFPKTTPADKSKKSSPTTISPSKGMTYDFQLTPQQLKHELPTNPGKGTSTGTSSTPTYSALGLDRTLQPALCGTMPIITGNKIARKAAGECIVRATIFILNRDCSFMTKDLFMQGYRQNFGCEDLHRRPFSYDGGFLDHKMISSIIETKTLDNIRYYRIIPEYINEPTNVQTTTIAALPNAKYYSVANGSELPPIQPLEPRTLNRIIADFETRFISIATIFPEICPSYLGESSPLADFTPYIPIWYPDLSPSASTLKDLLEKSKSIQFSPSTINNFSASDITPQNFGQILEIGKRDGTLAKKARNLLLKHATRTLIPLEESRINVRQLLSRWGESTSKDYPSLEAAYPSSSGASLQPIKIEQIEQHEPPRRDYESVWHPIKKEPSPDDMDIEDASSVDEPIPKDSLSSIAPPREPSNSLINATVSVNNILDTGNHGISKLSQSSQLRAAIKEERFKPYPSSSVTDDGSNPSKLNRKRKKAPKLAYENTKAGEGSNQKKEVTPLLYIPKGGIFTLPRPILSLRMGIPDVPSTEQTQVGSTNMSVDSSEANLGHQDSLPQPTREHIIKNQRETLKLALDLLQSLPMRLA